MLDDPDEYPVSFSTLVTHGVIYEGMLEFIEVNDSDASKVALVAREDAIGDATKEYFDAAFGDSDVETTEHRYTSDAVDITPVFQAAMANGPDLIVVEGPGESATMVVSPSEGRRRGDPHYRRKLGRLSTNPRHIERGRARKPV